MPAEWEELCAQMDLARPFDAPPPALLGDPAAVAACQAVAFESGDEDWWRFGADFACFEEGEDGVWRREPEDDPSMLPPVNIGTPPASER